ncbi:MAG TPA: hypothetical protein VK687_11365 [Bryobacteraceae bacterium]|nr:hypothetical protein [Bryobacteraceae bacterium]
MTRYQQFDYCLGAAVGCITNAVEEPALGAGRLGIIGHQVADRVGNQADVSAGPANVRAVNDLFYLATGCRARLAMM